MAKRKRGPQMGGAMNMMGQLQKLQAQIEETQAQLAQETVSASVGGGVIEVTVTGDQRVQAVKIDPAVLEDADAEMLQDLVLTAVNSALDKSRELAADRLGPLSAGLPF